VLRAAHRCRERAGARRDLWLAVLFAMSGQLNELGFMSYVGGRLSSALECVPWPAAYVALLGVFVEVGMRAGCRRR